MKATQCNIPASCAFSGDLGKYYYWDSFEACLSRTELSMPEIYLGIFAHAPRYFKRLLLLRAKIVRVLGLTGHTAAQLYNIEIKKKYEVGEKIALFTLFSQSENEIIAGGNDKHMDFRVSVLRVTGADKNKVVLTTVVNTHNLLGRVYMSLIAPLHRFGVKTIMSNAVAAKRI
jgi:hypothetical protein